MQCLSLGRRVTAHEEPDEAAGVEPHEPDCREPLMMNRHGFFVDVATTSVSPLAAGRYDDITRSF